MRRGYICFLIPLFCTVTVPIWAAECHLHSKASEISWSERQSIVSPDCRWVLDVIPGKDDLAQALLRSRNGKTVLPLFSVMRSGVVYWNDKDLMVFEDRRYSNEYRLQVFNLRDLSHESASALQFDKLVRERIQQELGASQRVAYYFPKFAAWTEMGFAISVGVMTTHGGVGPFTFHCYGFELAPHPARIVSALNSNELRSLYRAACQEFP